MAKKKVDIDLSSAQGYTARSLEHKLASVTFEVSFMVNKSELNEIANKKEITVDDLLRYIDSPIEF